MSKKSSILRNIFLVLLVSFAFGVGSKWMNREPKPDAPTQSPPVETQASKPPVTAGAKSEAVPKPVATSPVKSRPGGLPTPVATKPTYPQGVPSSNKKLPHNPYVEMMRKMNRDKIAAGKKTANPLDPNSPHPYLSPKQAKGLSDTLDNINPGQIKDKQFIKRNLYFDKLSKQLEELQNKNGNKPNSPAGVTAGVQGNTPAESNGTPDSNSPNNSNDEPAAANDFDDDALIDEQFEEEGFDDLGPGEEEVFEEDFQDNFDEDPVIDDGLAPPEDFIE